MLLKNDHEVLCSYILFENYGEKLCLCAHERKVGRQKVQEVEGGGWNEWAAQQKTENIQKQLATEN